MVIDSDAPFRLKDLRLYVHSFNFRTFGLIPYTVNGEMRFYFSIDEKCHEPDRWTRSSASSWPCWRIRPLQADGGAGQGSDVPADGELRLLTECH